MYIGNQPLSVAFLTDQFSGNGSTTAFTLSVAPANTGSILVAVSGVLQDPSTYAVTNTTLTFSAAPPAGTGNISVRYLGIPASGVTTTAYRTVTEFTATAGQTTFSVPSYTVGYISVFRNGVLLGSADYTATSGTSVILASAATAGDLVVTESFYVSSVLNAIPATAGAVNSTYLAGGSVGTAALADGGVTQAKLAANVVGNGPAFSAYQTTSQQQSIPNATATKLLFPTEEFDTNSNYDVSTSKFTPTVAGYYLITASVSAAVASGAYNIIYVYKNGTAQFFGPASATAGIYDSIPVTGLLYLNGSTDYVELYFIQYTGSTQTTYGADANGKKTRFQGVLVRAA